MRLCVCVRVYVFTYPSKLFFENYSFLDIVQLWKSTIPKSTKAKELSPFSLCNKPAELDLMAG